MDFISPVDADKFCAFATLSVLGSVFASTLFSGSATKRRERFRRFRRDESGAGYVLSFAMILPLYVLLICVVLETTFTILAKIGTVHSSFAAARAAIVRVAVSSAEDRPEGYIPDEAREQAKKAAATALVPFASGRDPTARPSQDARTYLQAYKSFLAETSGDAPFKDDYILKRHACAEYRTSVELTLNDENDPEKPWRKTITATVVYDAPYRLPYVGLLLGGKRKNGAVVAEISNSTTLPIETPQNENGTLDVEVPWQKSATEQSK